MDDQEIAPGIIAKNGKPVVAGSNVDVVGLLRELGTGKPVAKIAARHRISTKGVQAALNYALEIMTDEVEITKASAWRRGEPIELAPGIVADKDIRFGQATIKGTRMDVLTVLSQLAAGEELADFARVREYTIGQVADVLNYAANVIESETVIAATR